MEGLDSFFNKIKEVPITTDKVYKKSWLKIKLREDIPKNLSHDKIMLNGTNNDVFFTN
jgi:hypothetical protein